MSGPRGRRWLAGLAVLAACGFEPAGEIPINPPALYREWWAATEACSGLRGNFDDIRWYMIPGESFECPSGQCVGRWQENRIFLAAPWRTNELVVRHEVLHALIGRPGHPDPPFGNGCPLTWETWSGSAADAGSLDPAPPRID